MKRSSCIWAFAVFSALQTQASVPSTPAAIWNPILVVNKEMIVNEEPDEDFYNLFPDNKLYNDAANRFLEIAEQTSNEYNFSKLNRLQKKQDRILEKYYDAIFPNQKLTRKEKAYSLVEELSKELDVCGARNNLEMQYAVCLEYYLDRYKVIAMSIELLQQNAAFKKEIKVWQELHQELDDYCKSLAEIAWYGGSIKTIAIIDAYDRICKCRINDLERLSGKKDAHLEGAYSSLMDKKDKLMAKIEEIEKKLNQPEQMEEGTTTDDAEFYKYTWEVMYICKENIKQIWDKWIPTRRNLSNSTSMDSVAMFADELVTVVESALWYEE